MKEIIGLIATVAAAGLTAAAVSKKSKQNDEQELRELEKQMQREQLELEAEERRSQLEQARQEQLLRQELERQHLKQEQERIEYQRKLDNAPKKPVYKSIPTLCPRCNGARDISYTAGKAVCPYCDFVEPLVVDHYVIDQEAFQEQLRREEEERQEALKKKNLRDSRIAFWVASSFVSLIALPIMLGFHMLLLTYIYFIIWSLIALALYPTWKPILWASVFPVPLTKLITTSDTIKQKYNLAVRILFIVGGWLAYILLLGVMLLSDTMYSNRNQNSSYEPAPAASYTAPATTASTRPATEKMTEVTTEKATETETSTLSPDNVENIFDTFASIPDKNGFLEDTNQHIDKSYYSISLPDYYVYSAKDSDESKELSFYTADDTSALVIQTFAADKLEQSDFENQKADLIKKVIGDSNLNSIKSNESCTISGLPAQVARCKFDKNEGNYSVECCIAYYSKTVIGFLFVQNNDAETNYYPDYLRILDSIKVNESPAETEKPTLAITNYYVTTDSSNDKVVVVEYAFTNTFSSNKTFMWSFSDTAFQNGVECDDADSVEGVDLSEDFRTVQPGGTLKIKHAYKLTDASDVTIEVKSILGFTTYLSQKISLG